MSIQLNAGTGGAALATDTVAAEEHQLIKMEFGTAGNATAVSTSNPMPVVQTGTPALPTDAATQTTLAALNAKIPAQGQAAMAASVPVVIASDQSNIGTTDGGTSHTVDWTGQKTSDYDSGGGTDTVQMVGIALPASGGAVQGGTSTNPIRTDPTGTTTQPVSAASLPLPSGAATSANQSTEITHLATLAGAVAGTEVQVDFAQYTPVSGRLPVDGSGVTQPVSGTVTITPSGTQTVAGAKTNNGAVPGATNVGTLPAVANAAAPTQTEGNQVALRATLAGDLAVTLDGESVTISDGGGSVTFDSAQIPATLGQTNMAGSMSVALASNQSSIPVAATLTAETTKVIGTVNVAASQTIAVTNAGTFTVQDSQKIADNAAFTDGTTPVNPVGFIFDEVAGTALTENDIGAARMDSKRAQVFALEDATTRGQRQAVNAGGAAEVHGDAAHDAAIAGNPVRIGARAASATVTAVANGDTVDIVADLNGRQVVAPHTIPENSVVGCTAAITGTSVTELLAAAGAGIRNYLTSLLVTNSHATVSTLVEVRDGTTTVIWRGYALAAGGGFSITFPVPLRGTANTAMNVYCITTGSNVYVSGAGYVAP